MSDQGKDSRSLDRHRAAWRRWQMASILTPEPEPEQPAETEPEPEPEPLPPEPPAELLAQWRAEAEQAGREAGYAAGMAEGFAEGKAAGHAQGYAAGQAEGVEAARAQGAIEAARLHEAAQQCAQSISGIEEQIGQSVIKLALDLARQMVRTQLDVHPELILPLVQEILHTEAGPGRVRIWLHPEDLKLVQQHLQEDLQDANWRLLPDPELARGGCRAQTAYGDIDATLQTRWQHIAGALGQTLRWEEPQP